MSSNKRRGTDNEEESARSAKRASEVRAGIEALDREGTCHKLEELKARWLLDPPASGASVEELLHRAFANFGLADLSVTLQEPSVTDDSVAIDPATGGMTGQFGLGRLLDQIREHENEAMTLYSHLRTLELFPAAGGQDAPDDLVSNYRHMTKILEMIFYAKRVVIAGYQARLAINSLHSGDYVLDDDLDKQLGSWGIRFRWIDHESVNPMQKLLLYLLDCAMERKYRKQGGWVYEPITIDGFNTHAWRQVMEIKDFVHEMISKETSWEQWCHATASGKNIGTAVEYLTSCIDFQFPSLRKTRDVFGFRNGCYIAREDRFHVFAAPERPLADSIVAAKFFDAAMDPAVALTPWRDIPTPHLDSIMSYQQFAPDVCQWMYILLGRLLYDLGDLDSWQVIPFFKGMASSGKSTVVLKVAKNFFEAIDVGVLSNNVERKFGLSAFADKYLFVAPEIKNDLAIEQAEFQSIVSGEDIQINTKHQKARSCVWKVPGCLAGNEVPSWADNAGSIQRRIILFDFTRAVANGDMKLGEKLDVEMPLILVKCNKAYLEMSSRHSHTNIWQLLPQYFKNTRDDLAQAVNSVEAFLGSTGVVMDPALFVPMDDFKLGLKVFEQQNGFRSKQYTKDFFRGPLGKFGIEIRKEKRMYRGRNLMREYLLGVDLNDQQGGEAL